MLFKRPKILHSTTNSGKHWLTIIDVPPMQLVAVASNHCRAGHFLFKVVLQKLSELQTIPDELTLSRDDVMQLSSLPEPFPELADEAATVRLRLRMLRKHGGEPDRKEGADAANETWESVYLTPSPPMDWQGSYDAWIRFATRSLGMDTPEPRGRDAYDSEIEHANTALRAKLPALRERYLRGMDGLHLGFKIGLLTPSQTWEYVWVAPTGWADAGVLDCVLQNQPRNCPDYKLGQTLRIATNDLRDYAIGNEALGLVECGPSQRIAENYGMVIR